jgi:hypothetical protein
MAAAAACCCQPCDGQSDWCHESAQTVAFLEGMPNKAALVSWQCAMLQWCRALPIIGIAIANHVRLAVCCVPDATPLVAGSA